MCAPRRGLKDRLSTIPIPYLPLPRFLAPLFSPPQVLISKGAFGKGIREYKEATLAGLTDDVFTKYNGVWNAVPKSLLPRATELLKGRYVKDEKPTLPQLLKQLKVFDCFTSILSWRASWGGGVHHQS